MKNPHSRFPIPLRNADKAKTGAKAAFPTASRATPTCGEIFDVRFLRNPHYVERLRPTTGLDPQTAGRLHRRRSEYFQPFFERYRAIRLTDMLALLLPRYRAEGKSYLTIAVGCTGGRHRSVYVVNEAHAETRRNARHAWLAGRDWPHTLRHRDLGRDRRIAVSILVYH